MSKSFFFKKKPVPARMKKIQVRKALKTRLPRILNKEVLLRGRVTSDWITRITFKYILRVGSKQMSASIVPVGSGDALKVWEKVDKTGVKPYWIYPTKPHGLLVFFWGGPGSYEPHTSGSPARFGGLGAVVNGQLVFIRGPVFNPGFKSRNISAAFNIDFLPVLGKGIENAIRYGLRRS